MALPLLKRRAPELGVVLDADLLRAFERYRDELVAWNRRVNLTGVTEPAEIELRHFVDSLCCLPALDDILAARPAARLIDVGSGAGFPGLPIKLVRPAVRLTLLDSVRKKTAFLEHLVGQLGLREVDVVTARAEDLGREVEHRAAYEVVFGRALAPLPVLLELCLPFARPGGRLVAPRRGDLIEQQREAAVAARELGGDFRPPVAVELGPDLSGYGLVVVEKVRPTPERYPRRAGVPAKRPLG